MNEQTQATGSCLCGSIHFAVQQMNAHVGACHCSMCRHWSGGPWLAVDCGTEVTFEGSPTVFDSSSWAERGFCGRCGTHLFYRLKQDGKHFMPAGLFQGDEDRLVFDHQVFIDEKPAYYDFQNETRNMTGAEVFAQFSGSSE
jgi:hypothetical protein